MTNVIANPMAVRLRTDESMARGLAPVETLMALHGERIFRFVLGNVRDRDVAATLTQDTFVRAWKARGEFRGECSEATWLTRIALNLIRDHTRTGRFRFWKRAEATAIDASEAASYLPSGGSSSETQLIAREQVKRVWEAVEELTANQRSVFLMRFVEEMELKEIAEALQMPLATVKTHLYRAMAAVRRRNEPDAAGRENGR